MILFISTSYFCIQDAIPSFISEDFCGFCYILGFIFVLEFLFPLYSTWSLSSVLKNNTDVCFPQNILILGSRLRTGSSKELDQKLWVLEITDNSFEYMTGDYWQQALQQVICMDFSRGKGGGGRGEEWVPNSVTLGLSSWSEFPKKNLPVPSLEGLVPSAQGSWGGNRAIKHILSF